MKNEIIQNLRELDKFKKIIEQIEIKKTPINISGLVFVGKSHIISGIKTLAKEKLLLMTMFQKARTCHIQE